MGPLLTALDDPDIGVRERAAKVLEIQKTREAIPALMAAWGDPDLREAAVIALARMPDVAALPAYLGGLASDHPGLRDACRGAIAAIRLQIEPDLRRRVDVKSV